MRLTDFEAIRIECQKRGITVTKSYPIQTSDQNAPPVSYHVDDGKDRKKFTEKEFLDWVGKEKIGGSVQ